MQTENPNENEPSLAPATTEEASGPPPTKSLGELLAIAKQADDAVLEYDVDLVELGESIKDKVDGIVEYLDFLESRAAAISKRALELSTKAGHFRNKAARLEAYVEKQMDGTASLMLPGKFYRFVIKYSEAVIPKIKESAALALKYKGLIVRKVSYQWDKRGLKARLKVGDKDAMEVAYIERRPNLEIAPLT